MTRAEMIKAIEENGNYKKVRISSADMVTGDSVFPETEDSTMVLKSGRVKIGNFHQMNRIYGGG